MQNLITKLLSNASNGLYGTDSGFVTKHVNKNLSYFQQIAPLFCTPEQLDNMKQKGAKRLVQAINFSINGNIEDYNAVTAYMVSAVILSKAETVTFKDAHFLCGINKDDAQHVRGISRAKLARHLGNAGAVGTISSGVSRTTGKGGFFTALNITSKGDNHSFTLSDNAKNNPLILAYAAQLEKMTESAFLLATTKKGAK